MPNVQKDLGPVSAYAIAVKHGYTGTEEEWAALQIAAAENAASAAQSAQEAADTLAAVEENVAQETAKAVQEITAQKTASIALVEEAASAAGAAQEAAIAAKGAQTLATIPEDYTTLAGEVGQLSADIAKLTKLVSTGDFIDGGYINGSGKISTNNFFKYSDYLDVGLIANQSVKIICSFVDSAGLAFYDEQYNFISGCNGTSLGGQHNEYEVTIPEKAKYVRLSYWVRSGISVESCGVYGNELGKNMLYASQGLLRTVQDLSGKLNERTTVETALVKGEGISGYYISATSGKTAPFAIFSCSDYIDISRYKGYTLVCKCSLVDDAGLAFYDASYNFISSISSSAQLWKTEISTVIPANAHYFRYTTSNTYLPFEDSEAYVFITLKAIVLNNADKSQTPAVPYEYAAGKVLCIGDSLTSGAYHAQGWTGSSIQQNYPYYLGRMLNCEVTNAGRSGWSASNWYRDYITTHNYADYDTAIIWLGTNYGCATMPTDAEIEAFVPDASVSAENANQALYLIEIIKTIQEANPDCFILLCGVFASKADVAANNDVVQQIATKYGLHYVDTTELSYSNMPELHGGVVNVHFGKGGNIYIANKFANEIRNIIGENPVLAEFGLTNRTN